MIFKGFVGAFAAALLGGALVLAGSAQAADPPAPKITKEQLTQGAKEGPAVIAAAGIPCTPDQIYYLGSGKDPATKKDVKAFETTCKEGLGYLVSTKPDPTQTPNAYDCAALQSQPQHCILPGNAHPEQALAAKAAAAGRQCQVTKAVYNGSTSTGESFYELACSGGPGFEMGLNKDKVTINECTMLAGSPRACKLTTAEQVAASLQSVVAASGKTCQVNNQRFVGAASDATGDVFYEVGCASGPGFMLVVGPGLGFRRAIDCKLAVNIAGGCKFTDIAVTASEDAATYTRLASKAGFPCQVSKYRLIGVDKENHEVVELACTNRPDGGVAVFRDTGKSDVYDCVRSGALGQECKLSSPSVVYDKYSQALAAKGRGSCKVSNARYVGANSSGDYVETACADGLPGWVVVLNKGTETVNDLLTCRQAAGAGIKCSLPGNGG